MSGRLGNPLSPRIKLALAYMNVAHESGVALADLEPDVGAEKAMEIRVRRMWKSFLALCVVQLPLVLLVCLVLQYPEDASAGLDGGSSRLVLIIRNYLFRNPNLAESKGFEDYDVGDTEDNPGTTGRTNLSFNPFGGSLITQFLLACGVTCFLDAVLVAVLGFNMIVEDRQPASMWEKILNGLNLRKWISGFLVGFWAAFITLTFLKLSNWRISNVTYECMEGDKAFRCLDERTYFVCFCSFYLGIYFYMDLVVEKGFVIKFPTIVKSLKDSMRLALLESITETFIVLGTLLPGLYLFQLYLGGASRSLFIKLGYKVMEHNLGSLYQFCDVNLWIGTIIWPFLALFLLKATWKCLEFTFTEPLEVHIDYPRGSINGDDILLLRHAMHSLEMYTKYLGFHRFVHAVRPQCQEFSRFYELSHPGGHPRNFVCVFLPTMKYCFRIMAGLIQDSPSAPFGDTTPWDPEGSLFPNPPVSQPSRVIDHTEPENNNLRQRPHPPTATMRNLTYKANGPAEVRNSSIIRSFLLSPKILWTGAVYLIHTKLSSRVVAAFGRILDCIKKRDPDVMVANVLIESELVICGVNSLTELVYMSYSNDTYGVVQPHIYRLLSTLMGLYRVLHHYFVEVYPADQIIIVNKVRQQNQVAGLLLLDVIKTSLTRIHSRYSSVYNEIKVPAQLAKELADLVQVN